MNNTNKPTRSSSEKESYKNSGIGTRHSSMAAPNSNIHININLNVKKKSHCYHAQAMTGKKLNNFLQIADRQKQQKSAISDEAFYEYSKGNTGEKNPKILINTHQPIKNTQKNKKNKKIKDKSKQKTTSKPYTPEKQYERTSEEKSIEKSKTGKKIGKKKQSKSVENLKVFKQKPLQLQSNKKIQKSSQNQKLLKNRKDNKIKSRSHSSSKDRSREKSAHKLKKNKSFSKNVGLLQNSGIKKILGLEKDHTNKNESTENLRKFKKSLQTNKITDKDLVKINEFMADKKKNQEKKRKEEGGSKGIKIKQELLKASKKQFYRRVQKSSIPSSAPDLKKKPKYPIFFGDEQDAIKNQSEEEAKAVYSRNRRSASQTPQKLRDKFSKNLSSEKKFTGKKHQEKQCLVEKYISGKILKSELKQLRHKVRLIQACWRGFWTRKKLMNEIQNMNKLTSQRKKLIMEKKSQFWDENNNSIVNLDNYEKNNQINHKKGKLSNESRKSDHVSHFLKTPSNSYSHRSSNPTEENHTNHKKYESDGLHQNQPMGDVPSSRQDVNCFKKSIELHQKVVKYSRKQQSPSLRKEKEENKNIFASQIQSLKKQIEQQNKRFLQLQRENQELKQNLKHVIIQKERQQVVKSPEQGFSTQIQKNVLQSEKFSEIDDEARIYELSNAKFGHQMDKEKQQNKLKANQKFKTLKIQTQIQIQTGVSSSQSCMSIISPSNHYLQNLKKQLQSYQSPSNRSLKNAELSTLKSLEKAFKKKQLSIDSSFEKSVTLYQQQLQSNIVSPRTFNFKKIQLQEKYKKQKEEINRKFLEAEKVMNYISRQIVEEEKQGEDQSPSKISKNQGPANFKVQDSASQQQQNYNNENVTKQIKNYVQTKIDAQLIRQQLHFGKQDNSSQGDEFWIYSGNQSSHSNFKKYWTEDIQEVHKKVLQISSKIDAALQADSKQSIPSDSNKEYSSQNSNFQSNQSDQNQKCILTSGTEKLQDQDELQSPIFQSTEYQINLKQNASAKEDSEQTKIQNQQEEEEVMPNLSSTSSNSSHRNLEAFNIHYPSSPNTQKSNKNKQNFQTKNQTSEDLDGSISGNNSQLSQNRSSVSEGSLRSLGKAKQNRGFDTRLTFIKEYCIALCQFIRSEQTLKQKFISVISSPLKYDYFQFLKSYRTTIKYQNDTNYNSTIEDYIYPYFKIIKGSVTEKGLNYDNISKFEELYEQNYNINKELTNQMQQVRKYFIQAIIDVFNESLDFERPGSIYGEPLPWFAQSKNLKNNQVRYLNEPGLPTKQMQNFHFSQQEEPEEHQEDQRLDKIFGVAIAKIIQWGSCLCGFIPEPASFDGQEAQTVNIDQQQTNLVRETRLAYMLQKSLTQDEEKMIDHTLEEFEVQLQLQQLILNEILSQFTYQLQILEKQ